MNNNPLHNHEPEDFIQSNFNLIRIAIDNFEDILQYLHKDVERLKGVPLKPDSKIARVLLDYMNLKDENSRKIVETLCGSDLQKYFEWLKAYCLKYKCTEQQALKRIIDGKF